MKHCHYRWQAEGKTQHSIKANDIDNSTTQSHQIKMTGTMSDKSDSSDAPTKG